MDGLMPHPAASFEICGAAAPLTPSEAQAMLPELTALALAGDDPWKKLRETLAGVMMPDEPTPLEKSLV